MRGKREAVDHSASVGLGLLLALFFLFGIVLGQAVLGWVPDATGEDLRRYLQDFLLLEQDPQRSLATALVTLALYLRGPLLAFLLGFSSLGIILIPLGAMAFAFFLSFSVCCFTASFGAEGVALALAFFGLRSLVTLPCFFLAAIPAMEHSRSLAGVLLAQGRRVRSDTMDAAFWRRSGGILLALVLGACLELLWTPWLLQTLSQRLIG